MIGVRRYFWAVVALFSLRVPESAQGETSARLMVGPIPNHTTLPLALDTAPAPLGSLAPGMSVLPSSSVRTVAIALSSLVKGSEKQGSACIDLLAFVEESPPDDTSFSWELGAADGRPLAGRAKLVSSDQVASEGSRVTSAARLSVGSAGLYQIVVVPRIAGVERRKLKLIGRFDVRAISLKEVTVKRIHLEPVERAGRLAVFWVDTDYPASVETDPPEFSSVVEWSTPEGSQGTGRIDLRFRNGTVTELSASLASRVLLQQPVLALDTEVTQLPSLSEMLSGDEATFLARTVPPGYEEYIHWESDTKGGMAGSVLPERGRGDSFRARWSLVPIFNGKYWYRVHANEEVVGGDLPTCEAAIEDTAGCPGTTIPLAITITNTGPFRYDFDWTLASTGTPQVTFNPPSGTEDLLSGESSNPLANAVINAASGTGTEIVTLEVKFRGQVICQDNATLTVVNVKLKSVTFAGATFHPVAIDNTALDYGTPHWLDANLDGDADDPGDNKFPVSYTRHTQATVSKVKVSVTFNVEPNTIAINNVPVMGTGPDGDTFTGTGNIAGGQLSVTDLEAADNLPSTVKFYNTYDIAWKVAPDLVNFCNTGSSKNRVYVVYADPMGDRLESFFHIGTQAAEGKDMIQDTIDAIWSTFAGLVVKNVRNQKLGYYRGILCASNCGVLTAQDLVVATNGQCGSWADLLIQCLNTQGIDKGVFITIDPDGAAGTMLPADCNGGRPGFIVKNYNFAADGGTGCANYPKQFNDPCMDYGAWGAPGVTDANGLPGQDEPNPASWFARHYIVKITTNNKYYDPSYGTGPFNPPMGAANLAWENGAIAGFWGEAVIVPMAPDMLGVRADVVGTRETLFDQ